MHDASDRIAIPQRLGGDSVNLAAQPITRLKGVGPRLAERLAKLRLRTVQDVLFHLPSRYQDRTHIVSIRSLRVGDEAVIEGHVAWSELRYGRRRMLLVGVDDGTGVIMLRFFHFNAAQQMSFASGTHLRCFGEVRAGPELREMVHPEYRLVDDAAVPEADTLTPVYPATEGVAQYLLRGLAQQALQQVRADAIEDYLPTDLVARLNMPTLRAALDYVHNPPPDAPVELLLAGRHPAQQRLAFEELCAHHLSLRLLREQAQRQRAVACAPPGVLLARLLESLPFQLTAAQQRVLGEIRHDLAQPHPMQRLVQGDVGSGKTIVAAAAALLAVEAGYQVAVMAPTELLVEQHRINFTHWLAPLGITVESLSGRQTARARRAALEALETGAAAVAVGTHALFQDAVTFAHLGLIVIDEQHRFGVHQRLALRDKAEPHGHVAHQLIMTATPIPRTLAMTAYADLDISVIDELPPGRTPVETVVVPETRRADIVERVRAACQAQRQAYWVCPLIEESELLQCQAAELTVVQLRESLPELRIGLLHGRMKGAEKNAVMQDFKSAALDVLVATTVIEVGVDVPNASLMIIENAERLGLAQLHQLRGRVGRGARISHCVLMYHGPLSADGRQRLHVMRTTTDGFEIARQDLALRGPGEVLGTRQSGMVNLRIADLARDLDLLGLVENAATELLRDHPERVAPLIARWLGEAGRYGQV